MMKSDKFVIGAGAFIFFVFVLPNTVNYILDDSIKTPYGVVIYPKDIRPITEVYVEYYTIEDDFIYFYKKDESEPYLVMPKGNIEMVEKLDKPDR